MCQKFKQDRNLLPDDGSNTAIADALFKRLINRFWSGTQAAKVNAVALDGNAGKPKFEQIQIPARFVCFIRSERKG